MSAARKADDSSGSSVSSDSSDSSTPGEGIFKCDTVPPPDGESDAYSAPTKIGPMARGLVDQLMAQAEAMTGAESPPKSGERVTTPKPSEPPIVMMPAEAPTAEAVPRIYDASDDADPLDPSGSVQQQSGATKLLEVSVPPPAAVVATSSPPIASQTIAAQLDAYRTSVAPPRGSDMKLIVAVCVVVTLGLAGLYFFFLAA